MKRLSTTPPFSGKSSITTDAPLIWVNQSWRSFHPTSPASLLADRHSAALQREPGPGAAPPLPTAPQPACARPPEARTGSPPTARSRWTPPPQRVGEEQRELRRTNADPPPHASVRTGPGAEYDSATPGSPPRLSRPSRFPTKCASALASAPQPSLVPARPHCGARRLKPRSGRANRLHLRPLPPDRPLALLRPPCSSSSGWSPPKAPRLNHAQHPSHAPRSGHAPHTSRRG